MNTKNTNPSASPDTPVSKTKEDLDEAANVSPEEKELLERSENSSGEEGSARTGLDNTDEEGEPLNEEVDDSGQDLDIPGSEDDDADEATGGGDEENNSYSPAGDRD